jgi:hypothetical protein
MREQVETLKNHPDFATHCLRPLLKLFIRAGRARRPRQGDSGNLNLTALENLQTI